MEEKRSSSGGRATWAFQFISGKYQGSEFPLEPDRELVVGRASNTDVVLVEDMVSRKHARVSVSDDEVLIQDLGSTNGTFVNGEKVKRARLKDGDRVLIGTSILRLVRQHRRTVAPLRPGEPQRAQESVSTLKPRALQGDISEHGLPSLLQLLSTSKHSGVLQIQGPRQGRLYFQEGQLVRATVDGPKPASGKRALCRILSWTQGTFSVQPLAEAVEPEFEEAFEALFADVTKQVDEIRRARERLPPAERFELARPLAPPLKDLSPKRLDTLQLVINHGNLDAVVDLNPVGDLDTYRHLLFLLQKGYIQVAGR
jgi:hypothetical protein